MKNIALFNSFQVLWKMLARIAGIIANSQKESVTGVVLMDFVVEKNGQAMAVMEQLVEQMTIFV